MNTEKLEKLKKSLDNKFIPDNMKDKIRAEIQKLELEIKKDETITATEVKEEVKEIEKKVEQALEVADEKKEKLEEKLEEKKPARAKRTTAKKTTATNTKAKPTRKKTTKAKTTNAPGKKNAMSVAKEIRKPNESWNDALKRASASMRGESKEVSKKVTSELERLKAYVKRRKELKGISETNLVSDSKRKGLPLGKRVSRKEGNVYYEYRDNMGDRLAPNYPKNAPLLADGGGVDELDEYNIFIIEMHNASAVNKVSKVLTEHGIKIDVNKKWHTKGYGQEYYPTGNYGYPFTYVVDRRDAKNPKEFEKKIDGLISKSIDVLSAPVNIIEFENGGYMTDPTFGNFQNGVYGKGGGVHGYVIVEGFDSFKNQPLYQVIDKSDDTDYVGEWHTTRKEAEEELKDLVESYARGGNLSRDRKYVNYGEDYEVRYSRGKGRHGYGNLRFDDGGSVELDDVKVKVYKGFHGLQAENYLENVNGYDWHIVTMKRYSGDLVSSARGGKSNKSDGYEMFTFDWDSPNIKLVSSKPSRVTEKVIEAQHKLALQTFKDKIKSGNFADGGYNEGIEEDIDMTDNNRIRVKPPTMPKSDLSEAEWMAKYNESIEARDYTNNPRRSFDLGGNLAGQLGGGVHITPTLLDGNTGGVYTDLVGETGALSSGEMFAHGGGVHGYVIVEGFDSYKNEPLYHVVDKSDDTDYVGEWHTSRKEAEEELEDLVQGYARGGSTDRKYLNHSEDYEVRYAKGKNRHGYGNLKFADGGAVMANQQIIADASQQYVNYYLGEGASAGMFADGGAIKNQYKGRSPMDIWNNLTREQKSHFLHDHQDEIAEVKNFRKLTKNEISQGYSSDWIGLDDDFKNAFAEHISKGQYAIGGMMPKVSKRKHRNE